MATRKRGTSAGGKKAGDEKLEKKFKAALANLEQVAHGRCVSARDPFSAALNMAKEIRRLADVIENEAECGASTEAGYAAEDGGAVGIGVM